MLDEFDLAKQNNESSERTLKQKLAAFEIKEQEFQVVQQEYDDATRLQEIDHQIDRIGDEIIWAVVKEKEDTLQKFVNKLEAEKQSKEDFIRENLATQTEYEEFERKRIEAEEKLLDATRKLTETSEETSTISKKIISLEKQKGGFKAKINDAKYRISVEEKNIGKYEKKIKDATEKVKKDRSAEIAARDKAIATRQDKFQTVIENLKEVDKEKAKYQEEYETLSVQHSERKGAIEAAKKAKDRIRENIENVQGQQKSRYQAFPRGTRSLLEEMAKRYDEFESMPIGPIAMLLSLKNIKWAAAVQSCIRSGGKSFIVHSHADEKLIKKICQQRQLDVPNMIISKHTDKPYQISPNKLPPSEFLSVLDLLDIDETFLKESPIKYEPKIVKPTLLNTLIDQETVENVILIETREEATKVMFSNNPPQNAKLCITLTGTKLFIKGSSKITDSKSLTSTYWVDDYTKIIDDLKHKLAEQEKRIQQEIEEKEKIPSTKQLDKKLQELSQKKKNLLQERATIDKEIQKIKASVVEDEEEEDKSSIIHEWTKTINDKKEEIEDLKKIIEEEEEKASHIEEELQKIYGERKSRDTNVKKYEKQLEDCKEQLQKIMRDQVKKASEKANYERNLNKFDSNISLLEDRIKVLKTAMDVAIDQATSMCPERINTTETSAALIKKKEALKIRFDKETERFGGISIEEIKTKYHDRKELLQRTKVDLMKIENSLKSIQESLNERFKKWNHIRSIFSQIVSNKFNSFLAERGHSGSVEFDHEAGTMEIQVILESSKQNGSDVIVKDTKSLSGGERSYSTVSLLLALWDVVDSPFRALDEFDIFMDAIYRKQSMDLLIKVAKKVHGNRQLIILTPHDTSQIKLDENIKVLKLKKPVRSASQTILDQYVGN